MSIAGRVRDQGENSTTRRICSSLRFRRPQLPAKALAFVTAVQAAGAALLVLAFMAVQVDAVSAVRAGVVVALAIGYQQLTSRARIVRRFVLARSGSAWSDLTSVWTLAAALVLPFSWATAAAVVICTQVYWQSSRHRAGKVWRYAFSGAATLLSVATAAHIGEALHGVLPAQVALLAIFPQMLAYSAVSLAAVTVARCLLDTSTPSSSYRHVRAWLRLLPSGQALLTEFGALALGVVTAQLVLHSIVLSPLAAVLACIVQRASLVEELHQASSVDPKTGLLNVTAWQSRTADAARTHPGSVLMIDVDHFRSVNGRYGHLVGDRALRTVTNCIRENVRATDLCGRFGGEEFVVWLDGADPSQAVTLAERVRAAVAATPLPSGTAGAPDFHVTVSIGVASSPVPSPDLRTLLAQADNNLYAAKAAGRDVVLSGSGSPGLAPTR